MTVDLQSAEPAHVRAETETRSHKRIQELLKSGIDVLGAIALLVLLSPLLCIVALLVRLQDGGTAIHRRRVVGPKGEFFAYKFRTMRMDADQVLTTDANLRPVFERNFKLPNDPRVTKLGAFLRKYSLDELPQFFNVLKGEMSLVGPRMITAQELEKYGSYQQLLLEVKPGMTGFWQVNGRQKVSYEERVRMDVKYIRDWNLMLDLYILFKTPFTVIKGEGAY